MSNLLISGGTVLDPGQNLNGPADVLILGGRVAFVGPAGTVPAAPEAVRLDAAGLIVTPGLIDMHVHFREPGMEEEETISSGAAAAVAGGFTSVACMPNTEPALDTEADMNYVYQEAARTGLANVYPVGAITAGRKGEELAELGQMARGGAVAFSDDGAAVPTAGLLARALSYAKMFDKPILEHCEDRSLAGEGAMNRGYMATALGLPGIPAEAEEIVVARDVALARLTGGRLHIQHVSTRGSVDLIRRAKAEGLKVTAEVAPHHLALTEEVVREYDPVYKVNPPLRAREDVEACIAGLLDGTIDVIASDHAPHLAEEKELEFIYAPCGVIGLETTVGVLLTELVHTGRATLAQLLPALTSAPARILGLEQGALKVGAPGDVTLLDPAREWRVDAAKFRSKSRNCPFQGRTLKGLAVATVVSGRVVFRSGNAAKS